MKKADILAATPFTGDAVAVFQIKSGGYCRLMTQQEIEQRRATESRYSYLDRKSAKTHLNIVHLALVDANGNTGNQRQGQAVAVTDRYYSIGGGLDTTQVSFSRFVQCVNASQSFADYMTQQVADESERRKQREIARLAEVKQQKQQVELMRDLNTRINALIGESPNLWSVNRSAEVKIDLDLLARLVDLAETHATSTRILDDITGA